MALLRELDVGQKSAGFPIYISVVAALITAAFLFRSTSGTLTLTASTLTLENGGRVQHFPLVGATRQYGKWMQEYSGVKGSILYLASEDQTLRVGGEGFAFRHPAWYSEALCESCDVWVPRDAFGKLHEALSEKFEALAPPPAPPPPVRGGYRELAMPSVLPAASAAVEPWIAVELEPNPGGSAMQTLYTIRGFAIVLGLLTLYGAGMGLFFAVHEQALSTEAATAAAIALGVLTLSGIVFLALRKTYGTQLRIARGTLEIFRGPKILARAPVSAVFVEQTLNVASVRNMTFRTPALQLHFPSGQNFSVGCYQGATDESWRRSGAPGYLVGLVEWKPLLEALGLRASL